MAPITNEGTRDFEKIALIVSGMIKVSAHPILSKYRLASEDDFTNTLSSLVPHPIALAFQFKRRNMEGEQYTEQVKFRHKVCHYIRDYAKFMLLDSLGIAEAKLKRDLLIRRRRTRQANIFWNKEICNCILCERITMKSCGRIEWKHCAECKGWVCPYCDDCQKYHLSHLTTTLLETLEAAQSQKCQNNNSSAQIPPKSNKATLTSITTNNFVPDVTETKMARHAPVIAPSNLGPENIPVQSSRDIVAIKSYSGVERQAAPSVERVDFVQYLEETKSILALAHLMDDLESQGYDFDGDLSLDTLTINNE